MKDTQKTETLTKALRQIRQIQKNPIGLYRGREEVRQVVIDGIAESALATIKKK